jgi:hypothetical protein
MAVAASEKRRMTNKKLSDFYFERLDLRVELKYQEIYSIKFRRMRIN